MKKAVKTQAGARLPYGAAVLNAAADAKATVNAAAAAAAIAGGEWNATGEIYVGELVVSSSAVIRGLTVLGGVRVTAENVTLSDCRIEGKVGILNEGNGLTVLRTAIAYEESGILDKAKAGTRVRDCVIEGKGVSISTAADDAQIMYNTIKGEASISMKGGVNMIAACNACCGPIVVEGAKNTVVLKNSGCCAEITGCHAVYVIENIFKGALTVKNNNYIIADCNQTGKETVQEGNENENGNNLMDVDARLPYGADERLLPHVDKDLFVGMARKAVVCDVDDKAAMTLPRYVMTHALTEEDVIVPPGAYYSDESWDFTEASSNTTIYAYGVYAERQQDLGRQAHFRGSKNITIKGIYFISSCCGKANRHNRA